MTKKIFLALAAAALAFGSAQAKPIETPPKVERWIVKNDGGGNVKQFMESLRYMKDNKMALRVEGICASACTLLLSTDYNLDVCVMPDVKFGFHQPYAMDGLGRVHYAIPLIVQAEKIWREDFYKKYPTWVQHKIDENGGVPAVYKGSTPQAVLWLGYEDVKTAMKTCL